MSSNLQNSIWPNTDGNLGNIKVQIPDGVTTTWPTGDALVGNFVYKDGKLAGFVDTKSLIITDENTSTIFDYDCVESNFDSITEGQLTYKRGERSKYFDIKYKKENTKLPVGYISVDFLHAEIGYNTMELPLNVNSTGKEVKITTTVQALLPTTDGEGYRSRDTGVAMTLGIYPGTVDDIAGNEGIFVNCWSNGAAATSSQLAKRGGMYVDPGPYYNIGFRAIDGDYDILFNNEIVSSRKDYGACDAPYWRMFGNRDLVNRGLFGKKKDWKYFVNGELKMSLIPCINPDGVPCMYDLIGNIAYPPTYGTISAGLTLNQIYDLLRLPSKEGSLSLMLPEGYNDDENVVSVLESVRKKGWTLTIQTYSDWNETQSSTFNMNRIWVRKTRDDEGQYLDENGLSWKVEWCHRIYSPENTSEEEMGYEKFISVDAACEYWGLVPHQLEEIPVEIL